MADTGTTSIPSNPSGALETEADVALGAASYVINVECDQRRWLPTAEERHQPALFNRDLYR
jgi:hypothetical protein